MKKILLIISMMMMGGLLENSNAQCTLANPGIKFNYSTPDGPNCKINIDLYFDMIHNPGGKFAWVHIWPAASYSDWGYGDPPTLANGGLVGSIATFGIEHHQGSLLMQQSYPPDANAPGFQYIGMTASEGPGILPNSERYTIKNIVLTIPGGCNIPQSFTADVWQSQAAQAQNIHCFAKGLTFFANDPTATGFMNCAIPRTYSFIINTISNTDMNVNYKVFIDNGDGIFNNTDDNIEVLNGSAALNAGNSYRYISGIKTYPPYSGQKPYSDRDLWLEITTPSVPNAVYTHIFNGCIPLPVKLTAFTAVRKNDRVQLAWTTASEQNNLGFYIQRLNGNSDWQVVGFVPSAATNGNSDAAIQYAFTDINNLKGVTQYRLQQTDQDNKVRYSETRMVKGMEQTGKLLVFPNPSPDGNFNIVLDNMDSEAVIRLIDMNGKLVKEWIGVSGNKITVSHVLSGMYILQVQQKNVAEVLTVKVIISR